MKFTVSALLTNQKTRIILLLKIGKLPWLAIVAVRIISA
jgi:hypothetical protein